MRPCISVLAGLSLVLTSMPSAFGPIRAAEPGSADLRPARPIPEGADARARFLRLIERPRVAANASLTEVAGTAEIRRFQFGFDSETGERVTGILVKPTGEDRRRPVVISLHGTGSNKEGQRPFIERAAHLGFIGVAIDARHHGERAQTGSPNPGSAAYTQAILECWRTGRGMPFLYDTVWDVLRLVDWLQTLPDVDATRIGLTGVSKGGMETYLASAADPRIAVAVPFIGVQSFEWALTHDAWHSRIGTLQPAVDNAAKDAGAPLDASFVRRFYDRVVPGVYSVFDGPAMLPLIAPRPLLVVNGDSDPRTPIPGLELCAAAARKAYATAGQQDRFELLVQKDTGHAITKAADQRAMDWFVRWLKP